MKQRAELTRRELLRTAVVAGGTVAVASGAVRRGGAKRRGPGPACPRSSPRTSASTPKRLQVAYDLMEKWTTGPNAPVPGGAILVGRSGKTVAPRFFGRQGPEADAEPIRRDAMFYMASVTKPVIYMAAMLLVERGQLNLSDRVTRYVPEFTGKGKDDGAGPPPVHAHLGTAGRAAEQRRAAAAARAAEEVHRGVDPGRAAVQARHAAQLLQLRPPSSWPRSSSGCRGSPSGSSCAARSSSRWG